jgi:putative Mg2+ transporter-C (MgtC) family protein
MDQQVWIDLADLALAAALSLLIGLERQFYAKQAGMRTYSLVGMGSALFTLVGRFGFPGADPARVAAQVVTGIGFLGAGLIFVRRDAVRGLTTAAGIWFVAAVGVACGAGLHSVAALATALYLVVVFGIRPLSRLLPHAKATVGHYAIRYEDGRGVLRDIMSTLTKHGCAAIDLHVEHHSTVDGRVLQQILLTAQGDPESLSRFGEDLSGIDGVDDVIES